MNPQCIKAVEKSMGRKLGKEEAAGIGETIQRNMKQLALTDPQWQAKSAHQRLDAAAQLAREQHIAKANKQAERRALNLTAQTRNLEQLQQRAPQMRKAFSGKGAKVPAHMALAERIVQVANAAKGVRDDVIGKFAPALELAKFAIFGDKKTEAAFVHEVLRRGSVKDEKVVHAVDHYLEGVENLRQRMNGAGMDIGKLDYNYLPNPHDTGRIARATPEQYANDVLGMMQAEDRARMVNADGSRMNDAQALDFLQAIHETISTEGTNKTPNAFRGGGSRASRADNAHRELHLVTPEAWNAYNEKYGSGSVMESILRHVETSTKNIAMLEEMGPNPNATMQMLKANAEHLDRAKGVLIRGASLDKIWDSLNGTMATPVSPTYAYVGQEIRAFFGTTKLAGLLITQITDVQRLLLAAHLNGIPLGKAFFGGLRETFSSAEHIKDLQMRGIGVDDMTATVGRWGSDELFTHGTFTKLSQVLMKLTGARAWDRGERASVAVQLSGKFHEWRGTDWANIDPNLRWRMEAGGIKEQDWKIYQQAEGSNYRGATILDKDGIRAIPDAKLDVALKEVHDAHAAAVQAELDKLDAHNAQDQQWMDARQQAFETKQAEQLQKVKSLKGLDNAEQATISAHVLSTHLAEVQAFKERAMARQARREAVMQRLADLEPQKAATRTQAVNQAIAHFLGYLDAEGNGVIPKPDVVTKAGMLQGTRPGEHGGEFARFVMMYKGFGFQTLARLGQQLRSVPDAKGKLGILASTLVGTTLFGALSYQLGKMANGEDPEDMTAHPVAFAGKAIAKGGGFGMVSEAMNAFLGGDQKESKIGSLAGPAAETLGEIADTIHHQAVATEAGKPSPLSGDLSKLALENTPMINLWYAKAIIHHAFLDAMQEAIAPGYLDRMRRADAKRGATRFIPRGSDEPIRAPNLAAATGEQ